MKSVSDNPPARFPDRPVAEASFPWWVIKLKPRQEKAFAWDLYRDGVEYYLPMYTKVLRRPDNNKPRKSVMPLFAGYVSVSQPTPHGIFTKGRAVSVIEIRNQKRFVEQLSQIYQALEAGARLEPLLESYEPGTRVRVRSGPLLGVLGIVAQVRGESRLVLDVDPVGRASVSIDASLVEPV
jgi:hypothetical protein